MMRLIDFGSDVLLCHSTDSHALPTWVAARRLAEFSPNILTFDVSGQAASLQLLSREQKDFHLDRYLDRFYLWSERGNVSRRQQLLDFFFDAAAMDYETLVDRDRNRENIRHLLQDLEEACGPLANRRVIDFGCGVGLSKPVCDELGLTVIGFDRCPKMRQQAAGNGMEIWGNRNLAAAANETIDAAFSSYVFHLLPHLGSATLLWSRLAIGGALAANFHKGKGLDRLMHILVPHGAEVRVPRERSSSHAHGVSRLFVRVC
jgi:SAM-dependent methyltransferase